MLDSGVSLFNYEPKNKYLRAIEPKRKKTFAKSLENLEKSTKNQEKMKFFWKKLTLEVRYDSFCKFLTKNPFLFLRKISLFVHF